MQADLIQRATNYVLAEVVLAMSLCASLLLLLLGYLLLCDCFLCCFCDFKTPSHSPPSRLNFFPKTVFTPMLIWTLQVGLYEALNPHPFLVPRLTTRLGSDLTRPKLTS